MTRVDKADILELTVYHLTQLQQQQRSVTLATEAAAYDTGYKECARETVNYLSTSRVTSESTISLLNNHLHATFVNKSRNRHISSAPRHLSRNLSTPIRPVDVNNSCTSSSSELSSSFGCSPILPHANEGSYSDVSTGSPAYLVNSETSANSSSITSDISLSTSSDVTSNVVTIGNGKDNEVGHVIKEHTWRPWWSESVIDL